MYVAGVDEAGRGPLAGPVIAAAVILDATKPIVGLADSKKLTARRRQLLAVEIEQRALAYAFGRADVEEIDAINILQASLLAMQRAVMQLSIKPQHVLVDGKQCPLLDCAVSAIVRGDSLIPAISAASILAKVFRDREMCAWEQVYPGYGFAKHKGYPTRQHKQALSLLGITSIHRRSFAPVRACMAVCKGLSPLV